MRKPPLSRLAKTAMGLEGFLALSALAGGALLMAGPHGEFIPLPMHLLEGSMFADYFFPGFILFAVLGLGSVAAACLAGKRHRLAPLAAGVVGLALLIWMGVEISIVGFSDNPPLQPIYIVLGVAIFWVGLAWQARQPRR